MDGVQKQMMRCVVVSLQRVEDFLTIAHGDGEFEATRGLPWAMGPSGNQSLVLPLACGEARESTATRHFCNNNNGYILLQAFRVIWPNTWEEQPSVQSDLLHVLMVKRYLSGSGQRLSTNIETKLVLRSLADEKGKAAMASLVPGKQATLS